MESRKNKTLTLKGLVAELHKLGLTDIKERRLADWKDKLLLPPFDESGRGFGKGKGRESSRWKNRRSVIKQAVWIYRLLRIYRYTDELYLPLWMLGFPIPTELVREALLQPLDHFNEMFESEAVRKLSKFEAYERTNGIVEDYIGDLAFNWIKKEKFPQIFGTPQEVVEVPMNIFFNRAYEIDDTGFEDGANALNEWKEIFDKEIMPLLSKGLEENPEAVREPIKPSGIEIVFENAAFFQEHLSVPQLHKFVSEANEEDFRQVQEDMKVVRAIVDSLGKTISILMKDISDFETPALDDMLALLFTLGNLLVLTDISMRRNGSSEWLNWARGEIIKKVREDFNEETEEALLKESLAFAQAFEKGIKTLKKNFEDLIAAKMQTPLNC